MFIPRFMWILYIDNLIFCFIFTAYSRDNFLSMTALLGKYINQNSNFVLFLTEAQYLWYDLIVTFFHVADNNQP